MRWIILFGLLGVISSEKISYDGYIVYEVKAVTRQQIEALHKLEIEGKFDFWGHVNKVEKPCIVMIPPENQENFQRFLNFESFQWKILIKNVQQMIENERAANLFAKFLHKTKEGEISFEQYHSYEEMNAYLDQLSRNYPNLVTVESYGKSYEGRDLKTIRISKNPEANKPVFFIDGGIHAREWIAPSVVLYIIQQLVENPNNIYMIDEIDWVLVHLINPDGYEYTRDVDRLWRKTRSLSNGTTCKGVDANRNFDFHWDAPGSSTNPCEETYRGTVPSSESETESLVTYAKKFANRMKFYLTVHSYGQYILLPWGYTDEFPEDHEWLREVGEIGHKAIKDVKGTTYQVGTTSELLYLASGVSHDYVKGVLGINLSYTLELPGGGFTGFDLPPNEIYGVVTETFEGIRAWHQYLVNNQ